MHAAGRTLYQFPLSLYCEKTRWNLDHKQLPYRCRNLVPGLHLPVARALAGISTLPVLRDARGTVGDSTAIALWLELHYPRQPLLPDTPVARGQVLALEGYFDELGDHVRRCVWSLAIDSARIDRIFFGFAGYGTLAQGLGRVGMPVLRRMLRWRFHLDDTRVIDSWQRVMAGLDHVEQLLAANPSGYLVGDRFTLADLTAAAMLAPLFGPDDSPWSTARLGLGDNPGRDRLRRRPAGQWVQTMYRAHRGATTMS